MTSKYSRFSILVTNISRGINKIKCEEMKEFGLRSVHMSCLYYLNLIPNVTASELVGLCEEDKGAISRSLEYLQENGYIICDSEQSRKYRAKLKLTQKGKNTANKMNEIVENFVNKISSSIPDSDKDAMYRALETINENLKSICEKYGEKNENKNNYR